MAKIKTNNQKDDDSKEVKSDFKRKGETVEIREITNGFIARKSWTEGEGQKTQYKSEETYYAENPL